MEILQLAYRNQVVILDLQHLTAEQMDELLLPLLNSPNVWPTGYAFVTGDIARFQRGHPDIQAFARPPANYVELRRLAALVLRQVPPGLSGLCRLVLDRDLDKTQQLSNWRQRPLTTDQLHYAGLDAVCSAMLAEQLCRRQLGGRSPQTLSAEELQSCFDTVLGAWDLSGLHLQLPIANMTLREDLLAQLTSLPPLDASSASSDESGPGQADGSHQLAAADPVRVDAALARLKLDPAEVLRPKTESGDDTEALAVGKSIALIAGAYPLVVLLRGGDKIKLRAVRQLLGLQPSALRLARRQECARYFGYIPGTMPPLGFVRPVLTLADYHLFEFDGDERIAFGSGQAGRHLVLSPSQLRELVPASHIVSLSKDLTEATGGAAAALSSQANAALAAAVANKQPGGKRAAFATLNPVDVDLCALDKRFVADGSCGRLVRWMRCAGFDTEQVDTSDPQRLIAAAVREGRILLTIHRKVAEAASDTVPTHFMFNANTKEQFLSIVKRFDLRPDPTTFLMRCSKCNGAVVPATREELEGLVPPLVLEKTKELWRCQRCSQPFWQGTSYTNVTNLFKSLLGDAVSFIDERREARRRHRRQRGRGGDEGQQGADGKEDEGAEAGEEVAEEEEEDEEEEEYDGGEKETGDEAQSRSNASAKKGDEEALVAELGRFDLS